MFSHLFFAFSELISFSSLFLSPESSNLVTKIGLGEGEDSFPLQHRSRPRRRRSKTDNNGSSVGPSSDAEDDYSDSKLSVDVKLCTEPLRALHSMRVTDC